MRISRDLLFNKDKELRRLFRVYKLAKRCYKNKDKNSKQYGCYKYYKREVNRRIPK